MKEERMMILTMLEEGKISSEEALKLLDALDGVDEKELENELIVTEEKNGEKKINMDKTMDKVEKIFKDQGKKVENFGVDIGNKISGLFSSIKDKSTSINFLPSYETINTALEKDISHIQNPILDLKSINGNISVKPWDKENILIKIVCSYKKGVLDENDIFYDFYEEEERIVFKPIFTNNIGMKLEVHVPNKEYDKIILNTSNDKIEIEEMNVNSLICDTTNATISICEINGKDIKLVTKNGKVFIENVNSPILLANSTNSSINLDNVKSQKIFISTKNAKMSLKNVYSNSIEGITSNGSIELKNSQGKSIKLVTSNSKIICDDISAKDLEEMKLITSNASINTHFNESDNILHFDLETSLGNINLEIPNLVYQVNQQNKLGTRKIIAHSIEYDEEQPHLNFVATTSNGSITIN